MSVNLMIDIETLSTRNDAAVVAVGICAFDRDEILDTAEWLIDPRLSPGHRDRRCWDDFWGRLPAETRGRMLGGTLAPWVAAAQIQAFLESYRKAPVWANPPAFDIVIMRSWFEALEREFPVHFTMERDFRTLRTLAKTKGIKYGAAYEERTAHDALDDAIVQARAIQIINKAL